MALLNLDILSISRRHTTRNIIINRNTYKLNSQIINKIILQNTKRSVDFNFQTQNKLNVQYSMIKFTNPQSLYSTLKIN